MAEKNTKKPKVVAVRLDDALATKFAKMQADAEKVTGVRLTLSQVVKSALLRL